MSFTPSRHRRKPPAGKGSGAPGIENAAVERRKADRLRKAGAAPAGAELLSLRLYGAPLPLLGAKTRSALLRGAQIGTTNKNSGGIFPPRERRRLSPKGLAV